MSPLHKKVHHIRNVLELSGHKFERNDIEDDVEVDVWVLVLKQE